jgi:hypothetical protein
MAEDRERWDKEVVRKASGSHTFLSGGNIKLLKTFGGNGPAIDLENLSDRGAANTETLPC